MSLKSVSRALSGRGDDPDREIKVLVSLTCSEASSQTRERLAALGFRLERALGPTLLGRISAAQLNVLEADAEVAEVERSVTLRPSRPEPA